MILLGAYKDAMMRSLFNCSYLEFQCWLILTVTLTNFQLPKIRRIFSSTLWGIFIQMLFLVIDSDLNRDSNLYRSS